MGLIDFLDGIFFGEEVLNKWKNERENSGFKSVGDIRTEKYNQEKQREEILRREMEKYNHGHLFELNQVPEIIKNAMISSMGFKIPKFNESNWNKEDIKKGCTDGTDGEYILYQKFTNIPPLISIFGNFLNGTSMFRDSKRYELGLEYVENERGKPALRLFKKNSFSN